MTHLHFGKIFIEETMNRCEAIAARTDSQCRRTSRNKFCAVHSQGMFPIEFEEPQHQRNLSSNTRVCAIGAGIGGLHMAAQIQKGWDCNITILEQSNRFGGKLESLPGMFGSVHELGACWLSSSYRHVRELISEYEVQTAERKAGPTGSRDVLVDAETHKTVDLQDYIYEQVEHLELPEFLLPFIPNKLGAIPVFSASKRYISLHRKLFGKMSPNYTMLPEPKTQEQLDLLKMPFADFRKQHGLEALLPFCAFAQTAQGYGFLDSVSAFYGLIWINPEMLQGYLDFKLGKGPAVPSLLTSGYESIPKVSELFLDARCAQCERVAGNCCQASIQNQDKVPSHQDCA